MCDTPIWITILNSGLQVYVCRPGYSICYDWEHDKNIEFLAHIKSTRIICYVSSCLRWSVTNTSRPSFGSDPSSLPPLQDCFIRALAPLTAKWISMVWRHTACVNRVRGSAQGCRKRVNAPSCFEEVHRPAFAIRRVLSIKWSCVVQSWIYFLNLDYMRLFRPFCGSIYRYVIS